MKTIRVYAITFLLIISSTWAEDNAVPEAAEDSVQSWLSLADNGQFVSSWNNASTLFRAAISESDWVHSLKAVRSPLGALKSRELASATFSTTLPGAPDGEYVVFQFNTSFNNKASAIETVTMMKDKDDIWRVAGYFIK